MVFCDKRKLEVIAEETSLSNKQKQHEPQYNRHPKLINETVRPNRTSQPRTPSSQEDPGRPSEVDEYETRARTKKE